MYLGAVFRYYQFLALDDVLPMLKVLRVKKVSDVYKRQVQREYEHLDNKLTLMEYNFISVSYTHLHMGDKRKDYISWDEYFMGVAKLSGMRCKDPNTQVGCCIVSQDNKILSTSNSDLH